MVGERAGLREEVFKGRLLVQLVVIRGTEAGVEILLKIRTKVDFFKGIGLFALGVADDLLSRPFAFRLLAGHIVEQGNVFFELLEHRILDDLGVDHLLQLELVQGEHAHHLHQARCEYLPLSDFQAQSWLQQCHRGRQRVPE